MCPRNLVPSVSDLRRGYTTISTMGMTTSMTIISNSGIKPLLICSSLAGYGLQLRTSFVQVSSTCHSQRATLQNNVLWMWSSQWMCRHYPSRSSVLLGPSRGQ